MYNVYYGTVTKGGKNLLAAFGLLSDATNQRRKEYFKNRIVVE